MLPPGLKQQSCSRRSRRLRETKMGNQRRSTTAAVGVTPAGNALNLSLLGDGHHQDSDLDVESADFGSARSITSSNIHDLNDLDDDGFGCDLGFFDDFEAKLLEQLDNLMEKSHKTRIIALGYIREALAAKYLSYFVMDRKITIFEGVKKSLKQGKSEEQVNAIKLAISIWITMGSIDEVDQLFKEIKPQLFSCLNDASLSVATRSQCATALAIGCFIAPNGNEYLNDILEALYGIFSGSFFRSNGIAPTLSAPTTELHASALFGWSLLLTILPASLVLELAMKYTAKISQMLESVDVDLRIAAGETIAFLLDMAKESDIDYEPDNIDDLCNKLKQLATDNQKSRAKKDRKLQRSNFRDILKSVQDNQVPRMSVRFGHESLMIDNWSRRIQYETFCSVLGSGMNCHLAKNELLRQIFDLGPSLSDDLLSKRATNKGSWVIENNAIEKARTKQRKKLRDRKNELSD